MLHSFTQNQTQPIAADRPKQITSTIRVDDLVGKIVRVDVVLDIEHSDPRDLVIKLVHPDGTAILHQRKQGMRASPTWLRSARFSTPLRVEPNAEWKLVVQDVRKGGGGQLNWWRLELEVVGSGFNIDVRFQGGLTASQQRVFTGAAERWSEVIVGDLPEAQIGTDRIDDVLIYAEGREIDGPGAILGQAGPTHLREKTLLPIAGSMSFDSADLAAMERDGTLLPVILHEMGHVLGIGSLWRIKGLIRGSGTDDPRFIGEQAVQEWLKLYFAISVKNPENGVPLANTGGTGTREAHWRESVFHDELMTGYIDAGVNPMSRVTIASLADLGYEVNLSAADDLLKMMKGLNSVVGLHRQCRPARFNPVIV
jgi:subtilisin-like proprotein convertase family protein